MGREHWQLWRYCIVCRSKFLGTIQNLQFGHSSSDIKKLNYYLTCQVCHAINPLETSLIPQLERELAKKEFYQQKTEKRSG